MSFRTDPTYKEWKQSKQCSDLPDGSVQLHGSYLQGMETVRI